MLSDLEAAEPDTLDDEERVLLAGIARGVTNKDLCARLHLSERTVRRRIENIYSKLHLADRLQAAPEAREHSIGGKQDRGEGSGGR